MERTIDLRETSNLILMAIRNHRTETRKLCAIVAKEMGTLPAGTPEETKETISACHDQILELMKEEERINSLLNEHAEKARIIGRALDRLEESLSENSAETEDADDFM